MKSPKYQVRYMSSTFGTFALWGEFTHASDAYAAANAQARAFRAHGCEQEAKTIKVIPPGHEQS